MSNIGVILNNFYEQNILAYIKMYQEYPIKLISLVLDIAIVIFLAYELLRIVKDSRAWQLVKGIAFLVIATALSGLLNLHILNYILSTVMDWGVILIIIIFQPEIRRALEQLGGTNKFSRFFGFDKDIITKTKEDIYKVVIAVYELAKNKTGALIKASVRTGAIIAGAEDKDIEKLSIYAEKIGLAFQIKDDILSEIGDAKVLGKPVGNDKEKGKCTYVSKYGLEEAKKMLKNIIEESVEIISAYNTDNEFLKELALYIANRNK